MKLPQSMSQITEAEFKAREVLHVSFAISFLAFGKETVEIGAGWLRLRLRLSIGDLAGEKTTAHGTSTKRASAKHRCVLLRLLLLLLWLAEE